MARDPELGIFDPCCDPVHDVRGVGLRHAQPDPVPLADEGERLPVGRAQFGKQNPIAVACGAREQRPQQSRSRGGHRDRPHRPPSRNARTRAIVRGRGSRPPAQVEDKTRVANSLAAETGWSDVAPAYEFLYFSKQMHLVVLRMILTTRLRLFPNAIPTCLAIIYLANTLLIRYRGRTGEILDVRSLSPLLPR